MSHFVLMSIIQSLTIIGLFLHSDNIILTIQQVWSSDHSMQWTLCQSEIHNPEVEKCDCAFLLLFQTNLYCRFKNQNLSGLIGQFRLNCSVSFTNIWYRNHHPFFLPISQHHWTVISQYLSSPVPAKLRLDPSLIRGICEKY